jgi:multidrug transporter EmrE-like cation transporter
LTIIETYAQYNLKEYSVGHKMGYYLLGIIFYVISATIFMKLLSYEKVGVINLIWNIMSTLFVFIMGYLMFNENLNSYELVGAVMAIAGLILLGLK